MRARTLGLLACLLAATCSAQTTYTVAPPPILGTGYNVGSLSFITMLTSAAAGTDYVAAPPPFTLYGYNSGAGRYYPFCVNADGSLCGSGGGSGTVTSFSAGNLAPLFTTSVATSTTTPALSFALSTQLANCMFGGPTTGSAATPTCRALVNADIPTTLTGITIDGVSPTTMGFVDPTSSVQTQLNGKAASNASTTVNGQSCALGGSCTISAGNTNLCAVVTLTNATCSGGIISITSATATITISAIPQTYVNLFLIIDANSTGAATNIHMSFNGDTTTSDYTYQQTHVTSTTTLPLGGSGNYIGGVATTGTGSSIAATIPFYTTNASKVATSTGGNGGGVTDIFTEVWTNSPTAAVTSLTFTLDSQNFGTSRIALYGTN